MIAIDLLPLFIGSVLASTVLPGGVEILLYTMVASGRFSSLSLLIVSSAGNTLGGVLTYGVGTLLQYGIGTRTWGRYFRLKTATLEWVYRWGIFCLLFSWVPIIGDPLCLAAGYLRLSFLPSVVMIFIGKTLRYLALLWLFGWR